METATVKQTTAKPATPPVVNQEPPAEETKAIITTPNGNGSNGHGTAIAKADATVPRFQTVDLMKEASELPDLDTASELPLDLMSSYWTPEKEGETKNVFFSHVEDSSLIDGDTGEIKILRTAFFYEKTKDGDMKTVRNASKRLVGAIDSNGIMRGTPLRITYLGKKKNVNNAFKSDDWKITPLLINLK